VKTKKVCFVKKPPCKKTSPHGGVQALPGNAANLNSGWAAAQRLASGAIICDERAARPPWAVVRLRHACIYAARKARAHGRPRPAESMLLPSAHGCLCLQMGILLLFFGVVLLAHAGYSTIQCELRARACTALCAPRWLSRASTDPTYGTDSACMIRSQVSAHGRSRLHGVALRHTPRVCCRLRAVPVGLRQLCRRLRTHPSCADISQV